MIQTTTYDRAVALVRLKTDVVVLLYIPNDPLCSRARSVLGLFENRLENLGYTVLAIPVNEHSAHYEEVSCVRVPQLRVFSRSRLKTKLTGLFSYEDLRAVVDTL